MNKEISPTNGRIYPHQLFMKEVERYNRIIKALDREKKIDKILETN